jgi:hypothetical protein
MEYKNIVDYVIGVGGINLGEIISESKYCVSNQVTVRVDKQLKNKSKNSVYYANKLLEKIYYLPFFSKNNSECEVIVVNMYNKNGYQDKFDDLIFNIEIKGNTFEDVDNIYNSIYFFAKSLTNTEDCKIYFENKVTVPGGKIKKNSELINKMKYIHSKLDINTQFIEKNSEISIPISLKIPSLALGIATCGNINEKSEYILTNTIEKGLLQLLILIELLIKYGKKRN